MADILVLGPVRLVVTGREVAPPSDLQRVLVAVLTARRGRVVSVDELVEALWGERLPARPAAALQSQVFRLRRLLADPGCVVTDGAGYRLDVARTPIDADRFEDLTTTARRTVHDPARAAELYDEALALWRGRAYAEAADHDAVRADAGRLDELRVAVTEERAELLVELGRPGEAAVAMEALMVEHPLREAPVSIRMRALAAGGRHAEAVRVFAAFRRTLGEELGLDPSPELAAVEAEILRHERTRPPAMGLPGNSFIGRERDLATVTTALASARLVTLTGPGGVGKTRLALHVAARSAADYPDGVWLVELAAIDRDAEVVAAAATTLGLQGPVHIDRVVQFLSTRRALVVLDNCEHVPDGAQLLASALLVRTPDVDVLATSRSRLGVNGEHVIRVAPLAVSDWDDPDAPAVALFADRAAAVRHGFTLDAGGLAAAAALCRRLDGLPLAIELAAARTVALTPAEILAEVSEHADRLADRRRSDARHRSLSAVIDWSYGLLAPAEQHLFAHVAVFSGGFTSDAAHAVIAGTSSNGTTTADALSELVEQSLLTCDLVNGTTRLSMLEPIRQHAEQRLAASGALDDARRRHAAYFAAWITAADEQLRGPDERSWATAIGSELANLRAAHDWALDNDVTLAAQIVSGLYWYVFWYGASEVTQWAAAVIDRDPAPRHSMVGAYATAALGDWRRGDIDTARALAQRGIDIAGEFDPSARFAWEALSSTYVVQGRYDEAVSCHATARDLALAAGDATQAARESAARALTLGYLNRGDDAREELDAAKALAAATANPSIDAFCEYVAGELLVEAAPHAALPSLRGARDAARMLGNRYLGGIAGLSAVSCAARTGHPGESLGDYAELLDHFERTGSTAQQWTVVRSLIETLARIKDDQTAATLLGALDASTAAAPLIGTDARRIARTRSTVGRRLGTAAFAEATAHGAALGEHEALGLARQRAAREAPPPVPREAERSLT